MHKRFGKNDFIFVGVLLIICIAVLLLFSLIEGEENGWVVVTRDGKEVGRYPLSVEQTIELKDVSGEVTNVLEITEECAKMKEADCPDKLCVHQKAINRAGESIICLPNRVVVTVESEEEAEFDGISQ